MKRVGIAALGLCFILVSGADAHAWFWEKKDETAAPAVKEQKSQKAPKAQKAQPAAPAAQKLDKALEKELKDKRVVVAQKMSLLNNTEWQIELSPLSGKGKKETDTVTFRNNQVSLANYGKKGFPSTNITLTVQPDGSMIWETMQTSEKSGICFWRGELDKAMTVMRGVLSHKIDDRTKQDYSFTSTSRRTLPAGQ
ncbi:MAG TPA: hypothetical protein PLP56_04135 [Candidatus Omnitrophota bacterium]|nr:hypothetical protein [Candidatus Omnitrophota bacterium]HNQ50596.1 hypothetical protein [Candidatus Omnitrophota bacterium]HQO38221.1 hypothetical protein [Candidatus Omnitrophota bacterium]HQQ06152.1 hypothetical protein [Candidatus Omnitrophota bacterium]